MNSESGIQNSELRKLGLLNVLMVLAIAFVG
jgi:hypothetical protein